MCNRLAGNLKETCLRSPVRIVNVLSWYSKSISFVSENKKPSMSQAESQDREELFSKTSVGDFFVFFAVGWVTVGRSADGSRFCVCHWKTLFYRFSSAVVKRLLEPSWRKQQTTVNNYRWWIFYLLSSFRREKNLKIFVSKLILFFDVFVLVYALVPLRFGSVSKVIALSTIHFIYCQSWSLKWSYFGCVLHNSANENVYKLNNPLKSR